MKKAKIYTVVHDWSNDGEPSVYVVQANQRPSVEEVVKACDIDFEPEKGETIEIIKVLVHKLNN